jgi:hypothetical protein
MGNYCGETEKKNDNVIIKNSSITTTQNHKLIILSYKIVLLVI